MIAENRSSEKGSPSAASGFTSSGPETIIAQILLCRERAGNGKRRHIYESRREDCHAATEGWICTSPGTESFLDVRFAEGMPVLAKDFSQS